MTAEEYNNLPRFKSEEHKYPNVTTFVKGDIFEVITTSNTFMYFKILYTLFKLFDMIECNADGIPVKKAEIHGSVTHDNIMRNIEDSLWRLFKRGWEYKVVRPKKVKDTSKYYHVEEEPFVVTKEQETVIVPNGRFY